MKKQYGIIMAAVAAALASPAYAVDPVVTVSGAVEIELSSVNDKIGHTLDPVNTPENTTDLILATAELAVDAEINNNLSAHVAFLYEEDDAAFDGSTFAVDEATMTLKLAANGALTAGRMFVPFGSFESNMVSDPLTLELGETSETAFLVSVADRGTTGALYVFKGDARETSATPPLTAEDDDEFSYGANIAYASEPFTLGVSYISNIADTDSLQNPGGILDSEVPGMGVNLALNMNNVTFIAEHVAASEDFAVGDELGEAAPLAVKQTPTASHYELAFSSGRATLALAYQTTEEAQFLGLPESVSTVALAFDLLPGSSLGIEYASIDDYGTVDNGTGETNSAYTVQLAAEF